MDTAHNIVAEGVLEHVTKFVEQTAIMLVTILVETVVQHAEDIVGKTVVRDARGPPINFDGYN